HESVFPVFVSSCAVFHQWLRMIVSAVAHAQRPENSRLQDLFILLSGHFLDDRAQQEISRIVVLEFASRRELQIAAAMLLDEVLVFEVVVPPLVQVLRRCIAGDSGSVREQVMQRYLIARILAVVWERFGKFLIWPQLSF